jgi:hypothetical protein
MEIWENKITQATRAALLVKLVPTIAWPLKRIHLLALLREASRHNRAGIVLARTYGFAIKGDRDGFMTDIAEFDKATKGCSDRQLLQILFTIILQQEMVDDVSFQAPEDELLTELVKIHGGTSIDIAKVKAEARKTLESKKPKPPKPEMKTTKSTKPTTKKGKAK